MLFRDTLLDNFDCLLSTSHFTKRTADYCSLVFFVCGFFSIGCKP